MKKLLALITCLLLAFSMVACNAGDVTNQEDKGESKIEKKDFTVDMLTITLPKDFASVDEKDGFAEILSSNKTMIMFLREDMHSVPGYENTTLDGYAELIRNVNKNFSPTEIKKEDGLVYIEYEFHNEEENQTYKYLTVMYEQGGGIFWTVQFATIKADFDSLRPDLIEWAKSVKFA